MLNIITNPFPYSTTAHDLYINHLVLVGWIVIVNTLRAYNHKQHIADEVKTWIFLSK